MTHLSLGGCVNSRPILSLSKDVGSELTQIFSNLTHIMVKLRDGHATGRRIHLLTCMARGEKKVVTLRRFTPRESIATRCGHCRRHDYSSLECSHSSGEAGTGHRRKVVATPYAVQAPRLKGRLIFIFVSLCLRAKCLPLALCPSCSLCFIPIFLREGHTTHLAPLSLCSSVVKAWHPRRDEWPYPALARTNITHHASVGRCSVTAATARRISTAPIFFSSRVHCVNVAPDVITSSISQTQ